MKKYLVVLAVFVCLAVQTYAQQPTEGSLYAAGKNGAELGACPLKTTSVRTDISGFLARVNVRQVFQNSFAEPIEADLAAIKRSEATINALRSTGLVITAERGTSITGTIAVSKIGSLAYIADVRLVTPRL